jgi:hypothetical protein
VLQPKARWIHLDAFIGVEGDCLVVLYGMFTPQARAAVTNLYFAEILGVLG